MADKPMTGQQAAARLLRALDVADNLSHEEAQAQISALVDAERAGQDVDADPAYAELLHHLDRCDGCMEIYAGLAEDIATLVGEEELLPSLSLTPPSFFAPARQTESIVLRVLRGIARQFELTLVPPRLVPTIATLSGGQRINLFADRLGEVLGAPLLAVTLSIKDSMANLQITIREGAAGTRWQVHFTAGDMVRMATTDERGTVYFSDVPAADLQTIALRCVELLAEP